MTTHSIYIEKSKMTDSYLFVYGTLRQNSDNEMSRLLKSHSCYLGKATYQGKLYQVDYYPGAVPSTNPNDNVQGDVYQLTNAEFLLAQLDDYEECGQGFHQPTEYIRCEEMVTLENGATMTAWIYIFNRSTLALKLISSGDFYKS